MIKNRWQSLRVQLGLNKRQMADAIGVSPGAVTRWEGGSRHADAFAIAKAIKIAKAAKIHATLEEFLVS